MLPRTVTAHNLEISDAVRKRWQEAVDTIATLMNVPACLIMRLAPPEIEVFVASQTEGNPYHVGNHEHLADSGLYCERVISSSARLVVRNALADPEWMNNPDVKLHMIAYMGFPIKLPDGSPFGTICVLDSKENHFSPNLERLILICRDMIHSDLDFIHTNTVLRKLNDELDAKNSELREQKRLAEELKEIAERANGAKTLFLANMSHEIRTPMNGIMGMAELLSDDNLNEDNKLYLDLLKGSGRRIMKVIEDIIAISRIQANEMKVCSSSMNVRACTMKALQPFAGRAETAGLNFNLDISPDIPETLIGDEVHLANILAKVTENAIKFTDAGEISVTARLAAPPGKVANVRFIITDTGVGIPAAKMNRLFTPFFQVSGFHNRKHGGTGLGLTIARHLVELMNGDMMIDSVEDRGTTCTITLPFDIPMECATASDLKKNGRATETIGQDSSATRKVHVLIVEDDVVSSFLTGQLMKKMGFTSDVVENGQEALEKLKTTHYDLVLMDCQMPVMDGYAATRAIRNGDAGESCSDITIIAMTAQADHGDREKCLDCGMSDFIPKPVEPVTMNAILNRWLEREQPAGK